MSQQLSSDSATLFIFETGMSGFGELCFRHADADLLVNFEEKYKMLWLHGEAGLTVIVPRLSIRNDVRREDLFALTNQH